MSHTCKALLLRCLDFRLNEAVSQWLEKNRLLNKCDFVSLAGAVKNLVDPQQPTDPEVVLRQIEISQRLHGISEVILMNHTDCGAYGGRAAFEGSEEERSQHLQDLQQAKEKIIFQFPDLKIRRVLAKINPLGQISFEEIIKD